jgi:hypothetical protein
MLAMNTNAMLTILAVMGLVVVAVAIVAMGLLTVVPIVYRTVMP